MKAIMWIFLFAVFCFLLEGCKDEATCPDNENKETDTVTVWKPNLYLYPKDDLDISLNILFPLGGDLTKAIPEYDNGWDVSIDVNGVINNLYTYIFYEYLVPDYHQKEKGWIVKKENLKQFFINNMSESGFDEKEIKDFTDYWIPKFVEFDYYKIYPQYKEILNKMSVLTFSKEPDNFFRLQYLIMGTNDVTENLIVPENRTAKRERFFVMEWGVILN